MEENMDEYVSQWKEYFDGLVLSTKNDIITLEMVDIEGFHFANNINEMDNDVLCYIVDILNNQTEKIENFIYGGEKYVFLRKFTSDMESEIYLFLSSNSENKMALCIGLAFGSFVIVGTSSKDNMQQLVKYVMEEADKRI